jgi:hypothetical protein
MKKLILGGIGVVAMVTVLAFQPLEKMPSDEMRYEIPDFQEAVQSIPSRDFKVADDLVLDFDDKRF